MDKYLTNFQQFYGPLNNAQRAMFIGLVLVIITMIGSLFYWSQQEDQALLFGSLQPDAAQKIVLELKDQGVEYELRDGAIYVSNDVVHELRLQLAPLGGGHTDVKGYELFDSNSLGMTDFMQQVNKKRALEGELARSINSLEQVEFSRIHLVLPERSPFEESSVEASASVILKLNTGSKLKNDQIEGITSLIAGSVENLDAANVTVLDQAGNRLSEEIGKEDELTAGTTQMQLRQKTEAYLTERGQSMLDRVLGSGNSIVRVSVEHDFDRLLRESDIIDPDSRTIISEENREQTNNDEILEPQPIDQRLPPEQRGAAVVVSSNDNSSTAQTRNYEVNRTREVFEKTQGEIKNLSASVLLNYKKTTQTGPEGEEITSYEPFSQEEVEEFREVVMLALGLQQERGDQLSIQQIKFYDQDYLGEGYYTNQPGLYNNIFRWVIIGLTFMAVLFLIKSIRKKLGNEDLKVVSDFEMDDQLEGAEENASLPASEEGDALEAKKEAENLLAASETEASDADVPKQLSNKGFSKEEIVNFVELKPAEAAQILLELMQTEE